MTVTNSKRWYRRPSRVVPLAIAALIVIVLVVSLVSPWPAALVIRALFESNANSTVAEMKPYVPATGLEQKLNIRYGTDGADTSLDWFAPAGTTEPLPVVVWIHGGAWISGSKENVDPYAKILASHGYVAVSLNYSIAPGAIYPTALTQLNSALAFLNANAARFHIDPTRFVIAGDSAGAQLTAQLATMITSPAYATKVGLTPALSPSQLSGVVLDCGIYDVSGIPNAPGIGGWGFRTALWAYLGVKDWAHTAGGEQMSTLDDVTAEFPTTWISGGNGDPLTKSQSQKFAARLDTLGVKVTSVFYADDHTPSLPHEYQFHLKLADARAALASTVDFLGRITHN